MFVYTWDPAANVTTSGTPNTELANLALRQAARSFAITAIQLQGKGAGLTALSGISFVLRHWTTAGSAGTAFSAGTTGPNPRDDRAPAAATTGAYGTPTAGTVGGANKLTVGCGAAGPGAWVARNGDSAPRVDAGTADEIDGFSASGTASLNYAFGVETEE
jgi:hypothetical protein